MNVTSSLSILTLSTGLFVSTLIYPRVEKITKPEKKEVAQFMKEVTRASLTLHNHIHHIVRIVKTLVEDTYSSCY